MAPVSNLERRVSLHDLRILLAVVQSGSMGRAARQLSTSQPAVSRSIADLEAALGVVLLDRSPKGVEPTPYGRALVARSLVVFDELKQGFRDIQFLADPTAGELRIGASIALAAGFVATVLDRLSAQYPRLRFDVLAADTATAYRALAQRQLDLLVSHVVEPIATEQMTADILFRDPHVVVAGQRSPWSRRRRVSLHDLMQEPWTLPPLDSPYGQLVREVFRHHGHDLPRSTVTSTLPLRSTLIGTGRFLSMVPRAALRFSDAGRIMRALPIELPITTRPVAIITLKNRTANPAAVLFIECARAISKPLAKSTASS
jgi:DNA-binding transcriptional LysR family regulator